MYAFTIIETDTPQQARIAQIMLETAGYPTISATLQTDDHTGHIAITAAPEDAPQEFARIINLYAEYENIGVEMALEAAKAVKVLEEPNPRAVPPELFNEVRNALLHTLYTAASQEHVTVLDSMPVYSALTDHHDPGDEDRVPTYVADVPTAPVHTTENDSTDKWDNFKPGRDVAFVARSGGNP